MLSMYRLFDMSNHSWRSSTLPQVATLVFVNGRKLRQANPRLDRENFWCRFLFEKFPSHLGAFGVYWCKTTQRRMVEHGLHLRCPSPPNI